MSDNKRGGNNDRRKMSGGSNGRLIWITGLSGSGKSTAVRLGKRVVRGIV
ncbi:MAG: hypothetical protein K5780_05095 [Alphaproteobacteria bacterium]|nr:hypothetical protein [Alphaproteobacteria bacterium]